MDLSNQLQITKLIGARLKAKEPIQSGVFSNTIPTFLIDRDIYDSGEDRIDITAGVVTSGKYMSDAPL